MTSKVQYIIRTLSYGRHSQCYINLTEEQAKEAFLNEFGDEPNGFSTVYTDGAFHPDDVKPITGFDSSDNCGCEDGCLCYTR